MARKSKYAIDNTLATKKAPLWRGALYVRISREDGDREESDSISNQRALLQDFISREPDIESGGVYIDDGWSGTSFDRPEFTRMMEDIKARSVNCVIVKDLSRFGRNYIEAGNYIEKVFPFMDVRFISVSDGIDSVKSPQSANNLIVPFKNIINDEYCRDISNKVRGSLDLKRRQGKFIGSFASYGYLKDPADHNRLVVDEYAAAVVRDIFSRFIGGMGCITIAKGLNSRGELNPSSYKRSIGLNYRRPQGENGGLWCAGTVRRILSNKIYTGTLVQGKSKVRSYKIQVSVPQPEDKWIEAENTHEAIVSLEIFAKAQSLLKRDTRTAPNNDRLYLFSGFLRCADCGRAMNKRLISQPYGKYEYYVCGTYKSLSRDECTKHTIRADKLEEAVLTTIQRHIALAVSMDEIIEEAKKKNGGKAGLIRLQKARAEKEAEARRLEGLILGLYPDWKNGDITKEEYAALKEKLKVQLEAAVKAAEGIGDEISALENGGGRNAFIDSFSKRVGVERLTRELLAELVEYIYVHEGGGITIQFKFADEFKKAAELAEGSGAMTA